MILHDIIQQLNQIKYLKFLQPDQNCSMQQKQTNIKVSFLFDKITTRLTKSYDIII